MLPFWPREAPEIPVGNDDAIRCDACPVLCYIKPGRTGSCDRYANHDGKLVRLDPHVLLDQAVSRGESVVPFLEHSQDWNGNLVDQAGTFVTAIGAGTTYPDYKPAPFIISSSINAVDMVTVVTEGIFSYCGVKVKIDTDRYLGPETNTVRAQGEAVGHVTTSEYGSQMLSLGGVRHLTGGSRQEGTVTCQTLLDLCNGKPAELQIDGGASIVVQSGQPPIVDGVREERMRPVARRLVPGGVHKALVLRARDRTHAQLESIDEDTMRRPLVLVAELRAHGEPAPRDWRKA